MYNYSHKYIIYGETFMNAYLQNDDAMLYRRDKYGASVSALGFGCMRFTRSGGAVDLKKAEREVAEAMELGVNYFDSAYIYPGIDAAVGEIMSHGGRRDRVCLATKLPLMLVRDAASLDRLFETQLRHLKTDHIDYYLMHMLSDLPTWERLRGLGIEEWLEKKRASGQILRAAFSFHGSHQAFRDVLDAYPWDMCQIQYNYMDVHFQAGQAGLRYAAEKGVPVVIMEPLRGGRLVGMLPKTSKAIIESEGGGVSPARLALRWLWDQPEVTCVLSGMNSPEMLRENVGTARVSPPGCMTEAEHALIERVCADIAAHTRVGCTGCGYYMPCPKGVDIPTAFRCLNLVSSESLNSARTDYFRATAVRREQSSASQCVRCGRCETHCPQGIAIRDMLAQAAAELERFPYAIAKKAVRLLKLY